MLVFQKDILFLLSLLSILKVLLFYSNELSLIPLNLVEKAGKYLILFVI